jgi:hypothetical protein
VGHDEEEGLMTVGYFSRRERMSGGREGTEEMRGGEGEGEGVIGGVGKIGGMVRGGKEMRQCFVSIMAAFALRKSKPKMGCVTFA